MTDKKSPLDGHITDFLEHLEIERGLSPLTVRNYDFWLRRFSGWLNQTLPRTKLTDIDPNVIRRFRVYLARLPGRNRQPMAMTTQSYHVIALRSFLRRSEERRVGKECRSRWSPYH